MPSQKTIDKLRDSLEKEKGRKIDDEMNKVVDFLELLAKCTVQNVCKEAERGKKLEEFPKGFHPEEAGTCTVCSSIEKKENLWYDKNGIKCLPCQKAIDSRIIPGTLGKKPDSYYSETELANYFNLKGKVLNSFIKDGKLTARIVSGVDKAVHIRFFLLKDNKQFLPPKRLVKSNWSKDDTSERKGYGFYPWYYFHDPKLHLENYGISEYLRFEKEV